MHRGYSDDDAGERELLRLTAPNPSPMTGDGTNTYILGTEDVVVIDPGPVINGHLERIISAVNGRPVRAVLVTHSHLDHSPAAHPLSASLDAPVMAFGPSHAGRSPMMEILAGTVGGGEGVDTSFAPDQTLADGDILQGQGWTLRAHHTPGHMANHLSFEWCERSEVFTGDTVMDWASTLISPPDGDLGQFLASMDRLEKLEARRFHPGHGASVQSPSARCADLRSHRQSREDAILTHLDRPRSIPDLVSRIYTDTPAALHPAAARNVLAHLVHLYEQAKVKPSPELQPDAIWTRL